MNPLDVSKKHWLELKNVFERINKESFFDKTDLEQLCHTLFLNSFIINEHEGVPTHVSVNFSNEIEVFHVNTSIDKKTKFSVYSIDNIGIGGHFKIMDGFQDNQHSLEVFVLTVSGFSCPCFIAQRLYKSLVSEGEVKTTMMTNIKKHFPKINTMLREIHIEIHECPPYPGMGSSEKHDEELKNSQLKRAYPENLLHYDGRTNINYKELTKQQWEEIIHV